MFIKRQGQRIVVYRSTRQQGKVRSQYVGSGLTALRMAIQDMDARIDTHRVRRQVTEQDQTITRWSRDVEQLTRAVLTIAGYHRHHRDQWRRRNVNQINPAPTEKSVRRPLSPEVEALRLRVVHGDFDLTSSEARMLLHAMPEMVNVGRILPVELTNSLLNRLGNSVFFRETIRAQVEQVRDDLAGPAPTSMEALLAERAAICWLACHVFERGDIEARNPSPSEAAFRQRKIDGAHRRFLSAIRTLATVRKLKLPDLNITLDQRSVHIKNPTSGRQTREIPLRSIDVDSP